MPVINTAYKTAGWGPDISAISAWLDFSIVVYSCFPFQILQISVGVMWDRGGVLKSPKRGGGGRVQQLHSLEHGQSGEREALSTPTGQTRTNSQVRWKAGAWKRNRWWRNWARAVCGYTSGRRHGAGKGRVGSGCGSRATRRVFSGHAASRSFSCLDVWGKLWVCFSRFTAVLHIKKKNLVLKGCGAEVSHSQHSALGS